jgi:hypothetical protein
LAGLSTATPFPVEKAMKMSPEESYPLPPTLASPTVARFASLCRQSHGSGVNLALVWEERTVCPDNNNYTSVFGEMRRFLR